MRKLAVGIAIVLSLSMGACKCGLEKANVQNATDTQELIFPEYLELCKKSGMDAEKMKNRQKLVDSARDTMAALKRAVEGK